MEPAAAVAGAQGPCFTPRMLPLVAPTPPDELLDGHARLGAHNVFSVQAPSYDVRCFSAEYEQHLKMIVVREGSLALETENTTTTLQPGQVVLLPLKSAFSMRYQSGDSPRGRLLQWRFPTEVLAEHQPLLTLHSPRILSEGGAQERIVADLARSLARNFSDLATGQLNRCLSLMIDSLALLAPDSSTDSDTHREELALRTIELHLCSPDLTPTRIAEAQGISRRYLDGVMKRRGHGSISQAIRKLRLERARKTLSSGSQLSLLRLALSVGFENQSHFSRSFRESYGVSPSAFRRSES